MSEENKFIGGPEDLSYDFTEEEIWTTVERREQFQAELLRELNGKKIEQPKDLQQSKCGAEWLRIERMLARGEATPQEFLIPCG